MLRLKAFRSIEKWTTMKTALKLERRDVFGPCSFSSDNSYISDRKNTSQDPLISWKAIHQKPKLKQLLEENCWKETSGGNAIPISVLSSVYHNIHFSSCDTVLHQATSQWDHTSKYGLQVTFIKGGNHYVWFCFLSEYIKNISHQLVISLMLAWNPRYAQNGCCKNS